MADSCTCVHTAQTETHILKIKINLVYKVNPQMSAANNVPKQVPYMFCPDLSSFTEDSNEF